MTVVGPLSEKTTAEAAPGPVSSGMYLGFRLQEHQLFVAASQIVRVAEVEHLHRLPGDLECNLGLVVNEGVAVGVLDLEVLLDLRPARRSPPWPLPQFSCVFGRFARGIAGFAVDELTGLEKQVDAARLVDLSTLESFR